jgi:hypothetical protein
MLGRGRVFFGYGVSATPPSFLDRLCEEEPQCRKPLRHGGCGQLSLAEQIRLVLANVFRSELIGRAVKVPREILERLDVAVDGSLSVITTLEFFEHHFAKVGHRESPYDPTLSAHTPAADIRHAKASAPKASFKRRSRNADRWLPTRRLLARNDFGLHRASGAIVGMTDRGICDGEHPAILAQGAFGEGAIRDSRKITIRVRSPPLHTIKRVADSQTKNQASRHDVDEGDKPEAGHERVRPIVEKTNRVVSSKSAELPDRIDQSERGGCRCLA